MLIDPGLRVSYSRVSVSADASIRLSVEVWESVIRRVMVWLLAAGILLSGGAVTTLEAGEPVFTKASDMFKMADRAMQTGDRAARLVRVEYYWGKADLTFRTAEFIYNAPILLNEGYKRSSVQIEVRDGKIKGMHQIPHAWMDEGAPDPDPSKAFVAAKKAGFADWLAQNTAAGFSMILEPWRQGLPFKRGNSLWIWHVRGWGPGTPKDFDMYLDAESLDVLGGKSAPKPETASKGQNSVSPEAIDDTKPKSTKKPGVIDKKPVGAK